MMIFYIIFVLSAAYSVNSEKLPEIFYVSENQSKFVGGTVEFVCNCDVGYTTVKWWKVGKNEDNQLLSSSKSSYVFSDRFATATKIYNGFSHKLQIKNIRESDAGIYECQAFKVNGLDVEVMSGEVQLRVLPRPTTLLQLTRKIKKFVGDTVEIPCYTPYTLVPVWFNRENNDEKSSQMFMKNAADNYMHPDIYEESFSDNTCVIKLENVNKTNAGSYEFEISSSNDTVVTRQIELIIVGPSLEISHISHNEYKKVGETVEFSCVVKYNVNHIVTWSKVNENKANQVIYNQDTQNAINDTKDKLEWEPEKFTFYKLKLENITSDNLGDYECRVETLEDSSWKTVSKKEVRLEVYYPDPIISISECQVKNVGETVDIVCLTEYNEHEEIHFFSRKRFNSTELMSSLSKNTQLTTNLDKNRFSVQCSKPESKSFSCTLKIKDIQKDDAKEYICYKNISGAATFEIVKKVDLKVQV